MIEEGSYWKAKLKTKYTVAEIISVGKFIRIRILDIHPKYSSEFTLSHSELIRDFEPLTPLEIELL